MGNNCAHRKEALNASDVQALKSPRIGIATATCRSEGFSVVTHRLILPNVTGATSEVSMPRIAACARLVPSIWSNYRTSGGLPSVQGDAAEGSLLQTKGLDT
jgi:hypothetical protein